MKNNGQLWLGVFLGMVLMALICFLISRDTLDKVEIKGPRGVSIALEAKDGRLNYDVILDSLYASKGFYRFGLLGWLSQKNIYPIDSSSAARALSNDVCAPFPDPNTDMRVSVKAWQDCAEKDVVTELRRMAKERVVPFHRVGDIIRVSVPASPPDSGKAFACDNGIFYGNTVQLSTLEETPKEVTVDARAGRYPCTNTKFSKMHMNPADIRTLFGADGQIDSVVAVPLEW